jgi:Chemotaxis phosphatase CheX
VFSPKSQPAPFFAQLPVLCCLLKRPGSFLQGSGRNFYSLFSLSSATLCAKFTLVFFGNGAYTPLALNWIENAMRETYVASEELQALLVYNGGLFLSCELGLISEGLNVVDAIAATSLPRICAHIALSGEGMGGVFLLAEEEFARHHAGQMLDLDPDVLSDDDIEDFFGEFCNLYAGIYSGRDPRHLKIGLPQTLINADPKSLWPLEAELYYSAQITTGAYQFYIAFYGLAS